MAFSFKYKPLGIQGRLRGFEKINDLTQNWENLTVGVLTRHIQRTLLGSRDRTIFPPEQRAAAPLGHLLL